MLYRGREYQLRLGLSLRILFDFLARYSGLPQNASQISGAIRTHRFYVRHGCCFQPRGEAVRRIPPSAVKVLIQRLRKAIGEALFRAGIPCDPKHILVSTVTVGNQALYVLEAKVTVQHPDATF